MKACDNQFILCLSIAFEDVYIGYTKCFLLLAVKDV